MEGKILDLLFNDPVLICSTINNHVLAIDLSNLKWKKKIFKTSKGKIKIVSKDPLLIVSGNESLYYMDSKLSTISRYKINSPDSLFYMEDDRFFEIVRKRDGFYCYDGNGEMVWRHTSDKKIKESAFMSGGLVFITEDLAQYLELKSKDKIQKDFTQYLEI